MWATFDTEEENPFSGLTDDTVLSALGVEVVPGVTMVSFTYILAGDTVGKFPTVIEAAASDPWNPHFRPAPAGAVHGWTRPVPGYGVSEDQGRPEVIHKPIDIENLVGPVKMIDTFAYGYLLP